MKRRVAVIAAGTLGAAAFAFPTVGFAKTHTHSPAGQAARCAALIARFNSLRNAEAGAGTNAQPIIQQLEAQTLALYNAECT